MPTLIPPYVPENIADWEERYRLLFERSELFRQLLCRELGMEFQTSGENDILEKVKTLNPNPSSEVIT